jgi:hypothetical protein
MTTSRRSGVGSQQVDLPNLGLAMEGATLPRKGNLTMGHPTDGQEAPATANPGFALGQLLKASTTAEAHPDASVRQKAQRRVENWLRVLKGMGDGTLTVGSRTPVARVPAWVTTEVMHGGFATGGLSGAGPLLASEQRLLECLGLPADAPDARAAITNHFLSGEGFAELLAMLDTGRYRLEIPEEGALLAAAWLVRAGDRPSAERLLDELGPLLGRLRFYPTATGTPFSLGGVLHVSVVREAVERLQAIQPRPRVMKQREVLLGWMPLYDRLVQIFVDTLDGPAPRLTLDEAGRPVRRPDGSEWIDGGWPCRQFPPGWRERAQAILDDVERLSRVAPASKRLSRPDGNFAQLLANLARCIDGGLEAGRMAQVRAILAHIDAKRGLPASARSRHLRGEQTRLASRPDRHELAAVAAQRLAGLEPEDGLDAPDELLGPITRHEAQQFDIPAGFRLSRGIETAIRRCRNGSLDELLAWGLIPSSECLGALIPALAAQAIAEPIADPALRRLYGALYLAFRRRRSVLLLNYEKQVAFEELPWVQRLKAHAAGTASGAAAQAVLRRVFWTAVTAFPHTMLPNPLVREMGALTRAAGLKIPLVEELAADIFMGGFTAKFLDAATHAAITLQDTIYERYYAVPTVALTAMQSSSEGAGPSKPFSGLCAQRAHGREPGGRSVADNGMVIEQAQILTTHNLAPLVVGLGLTDDLTAHADSLARRCFAWVVTTAGRTDGTWRHRLHRIKNAAYAWRQMVFFLSWMNLSAQAAFLDWAEEQVGQVAPEVSGRFAPALHGLRLAQQGETTALTPDGRLATDACLVGWTTGRHWLMGDAAPTDNG